ncbi:hypothetical protein BLNAU_8552 [Blattamonas nauphoetae]|uniref:Uncharacterized protein n=1 Tax=Blattamonas nauphoetae TaxID=2049346 RepID=A0ABQ9XYE0_9EUKA|nr:hypothetical protein BLNAU_8552 [Blattamonas nauphoetae]
MEEREDWSKNGSNHTLCLVRNSVRKQRSRSRVTQSSVSRGIDSHGRIGHQMDNTRCRVPNHNRKQNCSNSARLSFCTSSHSPIPTNSTTSTSALINVQSLTPTTNSFDPRQYAHIHKKTRACWIASQ